MDALAWQFASGLYPLQYASLSCPELSHHNYPVHFLDCYEPVLTAFRTALVLLDVVVFPPSGTLIEI